MKKEFVSTKLVIEVEDDSITFGLYRKIKNLCDDAEKFTPHADVKLDYLERELPKLSVERYADWIGGWWVYRGTSHVALHKRKTAPRSILISVMPTKKPGR